MAVDLQKESRRGRAARSELALVQEHIDEQKKRLFDLFCDPRNQEEVYLIREEAKALQRVEEYLEQVIVTGELAEKSQDRGEA